MESVPRHPADVNFAQEQVEPIGKLPLQAERDEIATEILGWLGNRLIKAAGTDDWARIDLKVSMAANVDDYVYAVLNRDGSVRETELPLEDVRRAFTDVRDLRYEEEKGTWYSIRYTMDPPSKFNAAFNFSVDPMWDPKLSLEVWAKDLEMYPRTESWLPRWLRQELAPGVELPPEPPVGQLDHMMYAKHVGMQVQQSAPTGWTYAQVHFREIGSYFETNALVRDLAGRMFQWSPPRAVAERFREFRASMVPPNHINWYSARLDIEYSGRENLQFNRPDEPKWSTLPPAVAYQEELRKAGSTQGMPDWLLARLEESDDA
ncbi:hypothetical protein WEH80_39635 [Actinomycetes bacterium KLBMP 9759]